MPSLERQLEQAYAKVAQTYEPTLADVPFRLATSLLDQAPAPDVDGGEASEDTEPVEQIPVPYVLLTAKLGEEDPPNTGSHKVEITIEAGDNVQQASAEGGSLDAVFRAATNPLRYHTITDDPPAPPNPRSLFRELTNAVSGFLCSGMDRRGDSSETEEQGPLIVRRLVTTFNCSSVTA